MNKLNLLILCLALGLTGCATVTDMHATGGSKSDGIVEMSYEYQPMQRVNIDKDKALQSAIKRCQSWGYQTAEAFDAGQRSCVWGDFLGCNQFKVTYQYQCLGENNK